MQLLQVQDVRQMVGGLDEYGRRGEMTAMTKDDFAEILLAKIETEIAGLQVWLRGFPDYPLERAIEAKVATLIWVRGLIREERDD